MSQRTQRVDELLQQEIGDILSKVIADPRIGFATVTDVETSPDLRHARVWVSVIGQPAERDATIAALERAMPFVRRELGARVRLRRIPELRVRLDDSAVRGTRVLQLLHELEEGRLPDDVPPQDESLPTPVRRLPQEGDAVEPADAAAGTTGADDVGGLARRFRRRHAERGPSKPSSKRRTSPRRGRPR